MKNNEIDFRQIAISILWLWWRQRRALNLERLSLRRQGPDLILVAGRHRLAAAKKLGWKKIKAELEEGTPLESRIWEATENVCRAELSAEERQQATKDLVAALEEKHKEVSAGKPADTSLPRTHPTKSTGVGRGKGGGTSKVRAKALEEAEQLTGKSVGTLKNEIALANLTREARQAAKEIGLTDSQQATVARAGNDPQVQLAKIAEIKAAEKPITANPIFQAWMHASKNQRLQFVRDRNEGIGLADIRLLRRTFQNCADRGAVRKFVARYLIDAFDGCSVELR